MSVAGRARARAALRWGAAFLAAAAMHLAIGLVLRAGEAAPGLDAPGPEAITITLLPPEPMPAEPAAASELVPPNALPEPATEPAPDVPDPVMALPDTTRSSADAASAETREPELPPPTPIPAPDAITLPPPSEAVPDRTSVVRRSEPRAADKRPPRSARTAERDERRPERQPSAPASRSASSQASAGTVSSAATSAAWRSQLLAYLQSRVRAPAGAGSSVGVSFSVGRGGQITSARLSRSSGDAAVDGAALAAFRGAVPPPPADYAGPLAFNTNVRIR